MEMKMESWISSAGKAPFHCIYSKQCSTGLNLGRLICNGAAPVVVSRKKWKTAPMTMILPKLSGIADYYQPATSPMHSHVYHWQTFNFFLLLNLVVLLEWRNLHQRVTVWKPLAEHRKGKPLPKWQRGQHSLVSNQIAASHPQTRGYNTMQRSWRTERM